VTSATTKRFQWVDRDTAARDLLQMLYYVPQPLVFSTLHLLQAIRSPIVIPELLAIAIDENRPSLEREYALRAISVIPNDADLSQLRENFDFNNSRFPNEIFALADRHPNSRDWLFEKLEQCTPERQRQLISGVFCQTKTTSMRHALADWWMGLFERDPQLLNVESAYNLRTYDGRDTTRQWLAARWDRLIDLCHTDISYRVFPYLKHWEELKKAVFDRYPQMVKLYDSWQIDLQTHHGLWEQPIIDLGESLVWQEMSHLYSKATSGDKRASEILMCYIQPKQDIPVQAAAIHFLGKLPLDDAMVKRFMRLVERAEDDWTDWIENSYNTFNVYYPVRYEAAEALLNYPSPEVWELFVNTYFIGKGHIRSGWIAGLTDILSGLDVIYTGRTWKVEDRPWFRALAEDQ
jgi:hypothetical protein